MNENLNLVEILKDCLKGTKLYTPMPNTGMLHSLLEKYIGDDFDYIKQKSLMIGDASGKNGQFSDSDKKTAENFGIAYMNVNDFVTNWKD